MGGYIGSELKRIQRAVIEIPNYDTIYDYIVTKDSSFSTDPIKVYYELIDGEYVKTSDVIMNPSKTYYEYHKNYGSNKKVVKKILMGDENGNPITVLSPFDYFINDECLPYPFYGGCSVVYNNELHILGGASTNNPIYQNTTDYAYRHYVYNAIKNEWRRLENIPVPFSFGSAVVYHDKIVIIGGGEFTNPNAEITIPSGMRSQIYTWDDTSGWVKVTDGLGPDWSYYGSSAVVYNDEIWIMGGVYSSFRTAITIVSEWSEGRWGFSTEYDALPYTFMFGVAVVYDDRIHLIGGKSVGSETIIRTHVAIDSNTIYDSSHPYELYPNLNVGICGGSAVIYDDKLHLFGGTVDQTSSTYSPKKYPKHYVFDINGTSRSFNYVDDMPQYEDTEGGIFYGSASILNIPTKRTKVNDEYTYYDYKDYICLLGGISYHLFAKNDTKSSKIYSQFYMYSIDNNQGYYGVPNDPEIKDYLNYREYVEISLNNSYIVKTDDSVNNNEYYIVKYHHRSHDYANNKIRIYKFRILDGKNKYSWELLYSIPYTSLPDNSQSNDFRPLPQNTTYCNGKIYIFGYEWNGDPTSPHLIKCQTMIDLSNGQVSKFNKDIFAPHGIYYDNYYNYFLFNINGYFYGFYLGNKYIYGKPGILVKKADLTGNGIYEYRITELTGANNYAPKVYGEDGKEFYPWEFEGEKFYPAIVQAGDEEFFIFDVANYNTLQAHIYVKINITNQSFTDFGIMPIIFSRGSGHCFVFDEKTKLIHIYGGNSNNLYDHYTCDMDGHIVKQSDLPVPINNGKAIICGNSIEELETHIFGANLCNYSVLKTNNTMYF